MEKIKIFIFFICWVILGISSCIFYIFNRNAELKRKFHPWFVIGAGILFVVFVIWNFGLKKENIVVFSFLIPAVGLITFLNIKLTKFCDSCGRTLYWNGYYCKMEFCSKCGAKLERRKASGNH